MRSTIRGKQRKMFYSRFIFAVLVMAMVAVGGLLTAVSDSGVATTSYAETIGKSAVSPELAATSNVIPFAVSKILYVGNRGDGSPQRLHTMDPDGGNVFTYTTTTTTPAMPDFSADSSKIAFIGSASFSAGGDLVVMNADGTNEHVIDSQHEKDLDYMPSWSPDGTRIVFARFVFERSLGSIFVINADGTNAHELTTVPSQNWVYPDWSPDGTKIVYVALGTGLYVMNADGSNQHMIIEGSFRSPAWSPDGTKIAYQNTDDLLAIANADGSNPHVIPNVLPNSDDPSWSPDGNWIAFSRGSDTFKTNLDGTSIINLTNTGGLVVETQPSWGGSVPPKVVVQGEDGLPVPGAQVFHNCELVGTTSVSGTLTLSNSVAINDELIARAAVYTGTTQKAGHEGWAYEVWLTNILQNNDGTESPYVVTDTARLTHTLKLRPTNAQIGFNLVASVEYNTTAEHLSQIESGFKAASEYLMDVTDGQMFFERVKLYEDGNHWDDADFQFMAWHPRASANTMADGMSALTGPDQHVYMHATDDFESPYNQIGAYTTLIHEFGHYAIGAYDEYYKWNSDDYPTQCTVNFENVNYEERASIMYNDDESSEFCATISPIAHNDDTSQGYIHGESVWQTLVDNWSSDEELWELRSPMSRGTVNSGPNFVSCEVTMGTVVSKFNVPGAPPCDPFIVTVKDGSGNPVAGADPFVTHNGRAFYIGSTDTDGNSTVVGALAGDTVTVSMLVNGHILRGTATISECPLGSVNITLATAAATEGGANWPSYWLEATPDWTLNRANVILHLAGDPPGEPTMYASQSGSNRQAVALTYNSGLHQYTGYYTFNPLRTPDIRFEVVLPSAGGDVIAAYDFLGGRFYTTGPAGYEDMKNVGAPHGKDPSIAPVAWGLLRPESMADIVVKPNSLPDGTGVMVGKSRMPVSRPNNLVAVGGPYSVQGQNAINGDVGITLAYESEVYCGLVPGSTAIYRYNGTGWEAIPTSLIEDWHQAGGKITQWGIYGVFAQPNERTSFSDVPQGSTFYDYVRWMTCRGIAGGYSDGTFRPSNQASRGQISKMIALTYQWSLHSPENGYTFADVPQGSTFHLYVEAAYREGVVSGYACGGAGEPCDGQHRPYFRPSNNVTRGQIAKIIANGSKFNDAVSGQTFEDVAVGSTFYEFVERMASRSIINGYACGGVGEPCGGGNRAYFRPQSNATRGQLSKMIYLAAQPR